MTEGGPALLSCLHPLRAGPDYGKGRSKMERKVRTEGATGGKERNKGSVMKNAKLPVNKIVVANDIEQAHIINVAVGNKPATTLIHNEIHEDTFDSANDFEEWEFSVQAINESEVYNNAQLAADQHKNNEDSMN
ncbi:hypothetical protein MTR_6g048110 [Medicago truncatula]|uniref:Uncharacterized protein n=1 Tax=Medicago truncatula TaxID=3880 RepID=A0A072U8V9_MEDTR|nr:hypothetical protein MTR_6g048110 [Medicago truncatula]